MPLLAFPGTAILVSRIAGLYFLKANRADEDPFLRFVDANSIEKIITMAHKKTAATRENLRLLSATLR